MSINSELISLLTTARASGQFSEDSINAMTLLVYKCKLRSEGNILIDDIVAMASVINLHELGDPTAIDAAGSLILPNLFTPEFLQYLADYFKINIHAATIAPALDLATHQATLHIVSSGMVSPTISLNSTTDSFPRPATLPLHATRAHLPSAATQEERVSAASAPELTTPPASASSASSDGLVTLTAGQFTALLAQLTQLTARVNDLEAAAAAVAAAPEPTYGTDDTVLLDSSYDGSNDTHDMTADDRSPRRQSSLVYSPRSPILFDPPSPIRSDEYRGGHPDRTRSYTARRPLFR